MAQDPTSLLESSQQHSPRSLYRYFVYGMTLHSEVPLALPQVGHGHLGQVEVRTAPPSYFLQATRDLRLEEISGSFYQFGRLRDHSSYVRWDGVGEFLISADGHCITGRQLDNAHEESFQIYLLNQAISFALVTRGFEPLHATSVIIDGKATVLLGDSGYGKSSLAACFLNAGYRLLTDDLLILQPFEGGFMAYPGPSRIKLFPKLARRFLGKAANGTSMNSGTEKLIIPLNGNGSTEPVPLKAIYTLSPPRQVSRKQPIQISVLSPREGFVELVKNTFNRRMFNPDRLGRQFEETARLVNVMRIKKISYPRILTQIPAVRNAIMADLASESGDKRCGD